MKLVTLRHQTYYVSEDIGYSAWVHVLTGTHHNFPYHVGYYDDEYVAKVRAKYAANVMARAVGLVGGKPVVIEGEHK